MYIVRHGDYSGTHLNSIGKIQLEALAKDLKIQLEGINTPPRIFTSVATRAIQSANIIAEALGTEMIEPCHFLWTGPGGNLYCQLNSTIDLIDRKRDEVVIIVTHLEYTEELPSFFASRIWNNHGFPKMAIAKGEAWYLDCKDKTITLMKPKINIEDN